MTPRTPATPALPRRLSLVAQTVDSLCQGIQDGHWQGHLPGERELCASLQVSRRTLRMALAELQRRGWIEVAGRRRRRIRRRTPEKPAPAARKVVAVLTPLSFLALPPRVSYIMEELRARLTAAGFVVRFHINPACYTARPARVLDQFVGENPATAWLVFSSQEPMQRWFVRSGIPCLIAGSCAAGITLPSVDVDFHAACHHAGGMLWRKGHRRIALVLSKGAYGGDVASEEGLRDALKDLPGAQLSVLRHDNTADHLCSLLDETLRSPQPPTAFLVARATHVLTVMMHLMRRGRRIPQDITVISRDNDPILDSTSPSVARYAVQPGQLASRISLAVRQLAETATMPPNPVRLMPTFIPGESV